MESIRSFPTPEPTPSIRLDFSPHRETYVYTVGEATVEFVNTYLGHTNEDITFTATISFPTNRRYASGYRWDFGDGSKGFTNPVKHTYIQGNTYQVSFIIIDNFGLEWGATKNMYIKNVGTFYPSDKLYPSSTLYPAPE